MKYILIIICVMCVAHVQLSSDHDDWSQLGQNARHTFSSETSVPLNLTVLWKYHLERKSEYGFRDLLCGNTSPAVVKDKVYLLTFSSLYCMNLRTGTLVYEVPAYTIYPYTPAVADERVFLAAKNDLFQCLNAKTGDVLWERELPHLYTTVPIVDDFVYVTADHSSFFHRDIDPCVWPLTEWSVLVALDKESGEEVWRLSVTDLVTDSSHAVMRGVGFPVVADGQLIFFAHYHKSERDHDPYMEKSGLICLDAVTGTLKWKCENIISSSYKYGVGDLNPFWIAFYNDRIYIGLCGLLLCLDSETQNVLWEYEVPGWAQFSVGSGRIVVHSWFQADCLDAETGEVLWTIPAEGWSLPALTENEVFIATGEELWRVDFISGEIKESYNLGNSVNSPVVARECVLVGVYGNWLYCLGRPRLYENVFFPIAVIMLLLFGLRRVLLREPETA